jgi:hypothetical protein
MFMIAEFSLNLRAYTDTYFVWNEFNDILRGKAAQYTHSVVPHSCYRTYQTHVND